MSLSLEKTLLSNVAELFDDPQSNLDAISRLITPVVAFGEKYPSLYVFAKDEPRVSIDER